MKLKTLSDFSDEPKNFGQYKILGFVTLLVAASILSLNVYQETWLTKAFVVVSILFWVVVFISCKGSTRFNVGVAYDEYLKTLSPPELLFLIEEHSIDSETSKWVLDYVRENKISLTKVVSG